MKKITFVFALAMLGLVAGAAEETLFSLGFDTAARNFYTWNNKGTGTKSQSKDGKLFLEVTENAAEKQGPWNMQVIVPYGKGFKAGVKYRVEATLVSSSDFSIHTNVSLNKSPWSGLANKVVDLKANQPAKLELKFTPKEDLDGSYRILALALGNAPVGTALEVSDVKLFAEE